MDLDIRLPIGALFLLLGGLLVAYGLAGDAAEYQAHSLGLNIDLYWGALMGLFGAVMLALSLRQRRRLRLEPAA